MWKKMEPVIAIYSRQNLWLYAQYDGKGLSKLSIVAINAAYRKKKMINIYLYFIYFIIIKKKSPLHLCNIKFAINSVPEVVEIYVW
jgi:hypothetical protein